jgi:hypothetical protein
LLAKILAACSFFVNRSPGRPSFNFQIDQHSAVLVSV